MSFEVNKIGPLNLWKHFVLSVHPYFLLDLGAKVIDLSQWPIS
jgi:hypothetical protein